VHSEKLIQFSCGLRSFLLNDRVISSSFVYSILESIYPVGTKKRTYELVESRKDQLINIRSRSSSMGDK
jgi:hypothetical protein